MSSVSPSDSARQSMRLVELSLHQGGEIRSIAPAQYYWDRFKYWWRESPDAHFFQTLAIWATVVGVEVAALVRSGAFLRFPVTRTSRVWDSAVTDVKTGTLQLYRYERTTRPALVPHESPFVGRQLLLRHGHQVPEGATIRALFVVDDVGLSSLTRSVASDAGYLGKAASETSLRTTSLAELARAHPGGVLLNDSMFQLGGRGSYIYAVW